ncbi:hypothetical protein [Frigoriglobus tundricola]|uniref:Uncharacterized protein n=1 Tax=Frigoriglobus tundricola TaxID=2774151 RepID=A0A6M5YN01_9BACT|nr:hypothetical protein [Frigoriglobus tundricola]QJW94740.1 hypothetical protein FTUN_2262 [Frigoriglobus tundricola]
MPKPQLARRLAVRWWACRVLARLAFGAVGHRFGAVWCRGKVVVIVPGCGVFALTPDQTRLLAEKLHTALENGSCLRKPQQP